MGLVNRQDLLIGVVAILLAGSFFVLNDIAVSWRIVVILLLFSSVLGAMYLVQRRSLGRRAPDTSVLRDMKEAYDRVFESGRPTVIRLRVFAYVGNIAERELMNHRSDVGAGLELRLLVRDPSNGSIWRFPGRERQIVRQGEILSNIERLSGHQAFAGLRHRRENLSLASFVRYHTLESPVFVIIAERADGNMEGFAGFYHLQERSGDLDYSGSARKVIEITDQDILSDFVSWYDHYWEALALKPGDESSTQ